MEMEMNSNASVVFEAENDDDSFYAEIRRQILLLTSEENEDVIEKTSCKINNHGAGDSNRSVYGVGRAAASLSFNSGFGSLCCWESDAAGRLPAPAPPVWLVNLWKHGKGTGVFIPQVPCSKNKRSGRMNNGRRRIYRPVVNNKD
ncbi:uncharacterized protein LOC130951728 [Arachis stenosperma]|uniref:uncharacterized protein LOC130951728 n=1 Tax=Arachis stenosperma TaxID=217475 RepID=UPI0025AC9C37|nr:uncharacterized protein LOC130951728 [Arachis stenosperma]